MKDPISQKVSVSDASCQTDANLLNSTVVIHFSSKVNEESHLLPNLKVKRRRGQPQKLLPKHIEDERPIIDLQPFKGYRSREDVAKYVSQELADRPCPICNIPKKNYPGHFSICMFCKLCKQFITNRRKHMKTCSQTENTDRVPCSYCSKRVLSKNMNRHLTRCLIYAVPPKKPEVQHAIDCQASDDDFEVQANDEEIQKSKVECAKEQEVKPIPEPPFHGFEETPPGMKRRLLQELGLSQEDCTNLERKSKKRSHKKQKSHKKSKKHSKDNQEREESDNHARKHAKKSKKSSKKRESRDKENVPARGNAEEPEESLDLPDRLGNLSNNNLQGDDATEVGPEPGANVGLACKVDKDPTALERQALQEVSINLNNDGPNGKPPIRGPPVDKLPIQDEGQHSPQKHGQEDDQDLVLEHDEPYQGVPGTLEPDSAPQEPFWGDVWESSEMQAPAEPLIPLVVPVENVDPEGITLAVVFEGEVPSQDTPDYVSFEFEMDD